MLNKASNAHESWLKVVERNEQHRYSITKLLNTKMSNVEEEERQLQISIAERETEGWFFGTY